MYHPLIAKNAITAPTYIRSLIGLSPAATASVGRVRSCLTMTSCEAIQLIKMPVRSVKILLRRDELRHPHESGGIITVGFIDTTCPLTSVYAACDALAGPEQVFNDPPVTQTDSLKANDAVREAGLTQVAAMRKGR